MAEITVIVAVLGMLILQGLVLVALAVLVYAGVRLAMRRRAS